VRESENGVIMRIAFLGLFLVTGFYLMTGIVYEEGGFGVQLVVKPRPSLTLLVGGGEDGAWQREHPNEPKPWWLVKNFVPIVVDDWEGGHPWWEEAYGLGFLATLLSWPVLGGAYVFRHLRRRGIAAPQSQLPLGSTTFSVLSVLLTVLAVDSWRVHLLPWDFEGTVYVAFLSFSGAGLFAFLALVIVVRRARSGTRARLALIIVPPAICLLVLAVLFADFFGEAWWRYRHPPWQEDVPLGWVG
jgi:hypothetical protein